MREKRVSAIVVPARQAPAVSLGLISKPEEPVAWNDLLADEDSGAEDLSSSEAFLSHCARSNKVVHLLPLATSMMLDAAGGAGAEGEGPMGLANARVVVLDPDALVQDKRFKELIEADRRATGAGTSSSSSSTGGGGGSTASAASQAAAGRSTRAGGRAGGSGGAAGSGGGGGSSGVDAAEDIRSPGRMRMNNIMTRVMASGGGGAATAAALSSAAAFPLSARAAFATPLGLPMPQVKAALGHLGYDAGITEAWRAQFNAGQPRGMQLGPPPSTAAAASSSAALGRQKDPSALAWEPGPAGLHPHIPQPGGKARWVGTVDAATGRWSHGEPPWARAAKEKPWIKASGGRGDGGEGSGAGMGSSSSGHGVAGSLGGGYTWATAGGRGGGAGTGGIEDSEEEEGDDGMYIEAGEHTSLLPALKAVTELGYVQGYSVGKAWAMALAQGGQVRPGPPQGRGEREAGRGDRGDKRQSHPSAASAARAGAKSSSSSGAGAAGGGEYDSDAYEWDRGRGSSSGGTTGKQQVGGKGKSQSLHLPPWVDPSSAYASVYAGFFATSQYWTVQEGRGQAAGLGEPGHRATAGAESPAKLAVVAEGFGRRAPASSSSSSASVPHILLSDLEATAAGGDNKVKAKGGERTVRVTLKLRLVEPPPPPPAPSAPLLPVRRSERPVKRRRMYSEGGSDEGGGQEGDAEEVAVVEHAQAQQHERRAGGGHGLVRDRSIRSASVARGKAVAAPPRPPSTTAARHTPSLSQPALHVVHASAHTGYGSAVHRVQGFAPGMGVGMAHAALPPAPGMGGPAWGSSTAYPAHAGPHGHAPALGTGMGMGMARGGGGGASALTTLRAPAPTSGFLLPPPPVLQPNLFPHAAPSGAGGSSGRGAVGASSTSGGGVGLLGKVGDLLGRFIHVGGGARG